MPESTARTSDEISIYREGVVKLFELGVNSDIQNSFPEHAAVLYEQFFMNARSQVRIFCKNLSARVFGLDFVVQAADKALKNGVRIEILIQDERPEESPFLALVEACPSAVIATVNSETAKAAKVNFSVMDNRAFRFENDRDRVTAVANMCEPVIAGSLVRKFEELQLKSTSFRGMVAHG